MPGLMTLSATVRRDRILLFRAVNHPHSTACDLLDNLVGADQAAGLYRRRFNLAKGQFPGRDAYRRSIQEIIVWPIMRQKRFQIAPKLFVMGARLLDKG